MRRTNVYLDDEQQRELRRRAGEAGRTMADLVREAVSLYLARPASSSSASRDKARHDETHGVPGSQGKLRPAARGFPSTPEEWRMRPYFIHDYDIGWDDLLAMLRGTEANARRWAFGRVLDGARWSDIWRLISLDELRRELPSSRVRNKREWHDLVRRSDSRAA